MPSGIEGADSLAYISTNGSRVAETRRCDAVLQRILNRMVDEDLTYAAFGGTTEDSFGQGVK
jgi:hypothetical protein